MAEKVLNARVKHKRDTSANWTAADPVLKNGEIIIVDTAEGGTRFKIGDGTKKYTQLPFEDESLRNLLNDKLDKTANVVVYEEDGTVLKDLSGNILYPYTLVDSVRDENGQVLSSIMAGKQTKITSSGVLKGDGNGSVTAAAANSDYLPAASPAMTGTPTAPTAAKGTNTTQVATTAFVQNALSGISAKVFEFGTTAPTNTNLLWIDTTNGSVLKYYNGTAWTAISSIYS